MLRTDAGQPLRLSDVQHAVLTDCVLRGGCAPCTDQQNPTVFALQRHGLVELSERRWPGYRYVHITERGRVALGEHSDPRQPVQEVSES
ncbi:hypothetical protein [Amycolatopsis sp. NPDC059657]|uniref:hypothetical protein n=1 Tax=Amycolatopsis sp. NPDC059657 TaxID=3346899 RepID=UPI00366C0DAE